MSNEDRFRSDRCDQGTGPNRPCRSLLLPRFPLTLKELFPYVRIVTDPNELAQLNAEVARRKHIAGRNCKAVGYRPNA